MRRPPRSEPLRGPRVRRGAPSSPHGRASRRRRPRVEAFATAPLRRLAHRV